eukprot:300072-Rhodomonas_salina.1
MPATNKGAPGPRENGGGLACQPCYSSPARLVLFLTLSSHTLTLSYDPRYLTMLAVSSPGSPSFLRGGGGTLIRPASSLVAHALRVLGKTRAVAAPG